MRSRKVGGEFVYQGDWMTVIADVSLGLSSMK